MVDDDDTKLRLRRPQNDYTTLEKDCDNPHLSPHHCSSNMPTNKEKKKKKKKTKTKDKNSDDDESTTEEEKSNLKWRGDPEKTYSDWKVDIVATTTGGEENEVEPPTKKKRKKTNNDTTNDNNNTNGGSDAASSVVETYNVHRYVLGFGPHKSGYFERLFQRSERYTEGETRTSRIKLPPLAASAFPHLLDFVYSDDDDSLHIFTENATALHFLGQYFEIKRLRWLAREFTKKDLSITNVDTYYQHGKLFHDDEILQEVSVFCFKNIKKIDKTSQIVQVSAPDLWLGILEKFTLKFEKMSRRVERKIRFSHSYHAWCELRRKEMRSRIDRKSRHMSSLIAEYCSINMEIDIDTFLELTRYDRLPCLASDAAIILSDLEDEIVSDGDNGADADLSSLQERCIKSLLRDWDKIDLSCPNIKQFLKRKKPSFLAELLTESHNQLKNNEKYCVSILQSHICERCQDSFCLDCYDKFNLGFRYDSDGDLVKVDRDTSDSGSSSSSSNDSSDSSSSDSDCSSSDSE